MNVRIAAAKVIRSVLHDGESLNSILPGYLAAAPEKDRGLLQELCYGTLRWQPKLLCYLNQLLDKPFKHKDGDLEALLTCGLYQLIYLRIPPHAAVSETVAATKGLKKVWAKGLVNAVLRRFQREREALDSKLVGQPEFDTAHPAWLFDAWQNSWPEQLDALIAASNSRPPMTLRVNRLKSSRNRYLEQLNDHRIEAAACPFSEDGIQLQQPTDVHLLPGFDEGMVSVQDEAAQLAAQLLSLSAGQRVLDACCAPGGKTCHILECLHNDGTVLAVDIDAERLIRVEENLERLQLQAQVIACDAANTQEWWDGEAFDRILLDAPCSATGVIRRHPDIKLLRTPADIVKLATLQKTLLNSLWTLLKPGGILLYATCSTLPEENDATIEGFLNTTEDAICSGIDIEAGFKTPFGRQLLPQTDGHDGFYYAKLQKQL
ncbi:MAG: 16S rRNA (cytosine(967)-C(5))-methyltransferase RsmB [Porticoccaceae bacterium]|nr:16S rRNA (cytosine(967)-C(5))-methyltransferase RsmB [Pseudomonadales bacterium]MCP5172957.1 16S rRNA (cytosine(967)-C(5))-methyltransferase RsmB [Pseudomonadales bacterium]MCP5302430.1 16S rRNA (cytosine(967)-C(5))-methyltransferase RsmB [Pseudomonadales bacterium]